MGKRLLTAGKKILLFIYDQHGFAVTPTQKDMAQTLGIRRNHVSRGLASLMSRDLVEEKKSHVKGEIRKMNTYSLTNKGTKFAQEILEKLKEEEIEVKHGGGFRFMPMRNLRKEFDLKINLSEVIGEIEKIGFLDLDVKLKERPGKFVSVLHGLKAAERFLGRKKELKNLKKYIASDDIRLILIYGSKGMGKSALSAELIPDLSSKMNIFWYTGGEYEDTHDILNSLSNFLEALGKASLRAFLKRFEEAKLSEILPIVKNSLENINSLVVFNGMSELNEDAATTTRGIILSMSKTKGVKLLITARSKNVMEGMEGYFPGENVKELKLEGLDKDSSKLLLGKKIKGREFDRIYKLTEGNPLYLKLASAQPLDIAKEKFTPDELALLRYLKVRKK